MVRENLQAKTAPFAVECTGLMADWTPGFAAKYSGALRTVCSQVQREFGSMPLVGFGGVGPAL